MAKPSPKYIQTHNITITHPKIVAQWHLTLNGCDKPEYYTASSKHN